MPAAIAIPAIIGAAGVGSSLVAAKMGSNAAKNAAKTQVQSADKAQAFNQQAFDYQKQITQPYISNGQTSLANLMAQHWGGSPSQYSGGQQAPQMPPGGMPLGGFAGAQGPRAVGSGQTPAAAANGGGMVQMRGKDGSVRPVPQQLVQKYLGRGAEVMH